MNIELCNPETKETLTINCIDQNIDDLTNKYKPLISNSKLKYFIDNLNISAEAKALIYKINDITITIGKTALKVGSKIVESIIYMLKKYPNTAMGLIIGSFIGLLVSSIPVFGWLLGPIIFPICTALGLAVGFWEDLKDKRIKNTIENHINEMFGNFRDINVKA